MYKVRKSAFLKWYFEDANEKFNIGERVLDSLFSDGMFAITTEDLFLECGFIPKDICDGQKPHVWPGTRTFVPQPEVELISD